MKKIFKSKLIMSLFVLMRCSIIVFSQPYELRGDKVFVRDYPVAKYVINSKKPNENVTIYFKDNVLKTQHSQLLVQYFLSKGFRKIHVSPQCDPSVLYPLISLHRDSKGIKLLLDSVHVGYVHSSFKEKGLAIVYVDLNVNEDIFPYIEKELKNKKTEFPDLKLYKTFNVFYDPESIRKKELEAKELENIKRLEEEERHRNEEHKRMEKRQEFNRLFNVYLLSWLNSSQSKEEIEGVYESINSGQIQRTKIVIIRDPSDRNIFRAYVLESNDNQFIRGTELFNVKKTASRRNYLAYYKTVSHQIFDNRLIEYNDGILKDPNNENFNFIKTYPTENKNIYIDQELELFSQVTTGSGIILNSKGYILTNYHVIKDGKEINAVFNFSDTFTKTTEVKLVKYDSIADLALLKAEENFPEIDEIVITQEELKIGQKVYTIGFPIPMDLGLSPKLNQGIISSLPQAKNEMFFVTDLPVWFGNSGGPCYDDSGRLIGLVTMIHFDKGQKVENLSYIGAPHTLKNFLQNYSKGQNDYYQRVQLKYDAEALAILHLKRSVLIVVK